MIRKVFYTLAAILLMAGCSTEKKEPTKSAVAKRTQAPDSFRVKLQTTRGDVIIEVTRAWAPRGADRFFELVNEGYYDGCRFYRVLRNFVVQWGINGDPSVSRLWGSLKILDDPVKASNRKGTVTFAMAGPASRATQVFINMRDNKPLDRQGFAPFGRVVEGMDVVERFSTYGEMAPRGEGPDPNRMELEGNAYIERAFPRLDSIVKATVVK